MDTKTLIKQMTTQATKGFFDAARKVPADKVAWSPMEAGRSVLSQAQEIAQSPAWGAGLMETRTMPDFNREFMANMMAEREQWQTIDACEEECSRRLEKLFEVLDAFPAEDLEATMFLPFGNRDWTFAELAMLHYWNACYHQGQVNYIQTLYGDSSM